MSSKSAFAPTEKIQNTPRFSEVTPFVIYQDLTEYKPFPHAPLDELMIDGFEDKENQQEIDNVILGLERPKSSIQC